MKIEHKSYLAEKISLHSALLFISVLINGIPTILIFSYMWLEQIITYMWATHQIIKIPNLLEKISGNMLVMVPISSLCTDFFIAKTVVMYDKKLIQSKFLYFMKLFLNYYICLTIFIGLKILIIDKINTDSNAYSNLTITTKLLLYYSINYFVVLIFIIVFYLKNKEYFRIQNFLIE